MCLTFLNHTIFNLLSLLGCSADRPIDNNCGVDVLYAKLQKKEEEEKSSKSLHKKEQ